MSSHQTQPTEAPPSYDQVSGSSHPAAGTSSAAAATHSSGSHLDVPKTDEAAARKSLEDMLRPLPKGWVRQYDPSTHHNFFVDTQATPPRSIWVHPFDDADYQREHPAEIRKERERVEHEQMVHADTDDEDDDHHASRSKHHSSSSTSAAAGVGGAAAGGQPKGMKKFGRSLKDKLTNTTHTEREAKRRAQKEAEERAYQQHQAIRRALQTATQTGQPQLVGKDKQGREIFAQPPPPGAYGYGATLGYGPYQTMDGPYGAYGPYGRPMGPYSRPYGGMGMGMGGMPLMGGLAGGMLLGGLLF